VNDESEQMRLAAMPLGSAADLDPLLERVGEAQFVLLGEASHGTHEFYAWSEAHRDGWRL